MEKEILFGNLLKEKAETLKDRNFLLLNEGSVTYGDLYKRVQKVARGLEQLGVGKGDKISLIMENQIEFLEVWFASANAKDVLGLLFPWLFYKFAWLADRRPLFSLQPPLQ